MVYHTGPKIVTDGLVLCLDAADRNSYPGSGTSWLDLSGNGNHGTFGASTAAPTFNSGNNGSIVFDGSDDYVISSNSFNFSNNNPLTISFWFKSSLLTLDGAYYRRLFHFTNNYSISTNTTSVGWYISGADLVTPVGISIDIWYRVDNVYTGSQYQTYVNGVIGNSFTSSLPSISSQLWIGKYHSGNNGRFNGNISQVSIYNKALSADEIRQNYKATKGRFGL